MIHEIKLPPLGETMEEGTVLKWLKDTGDHVEKKQPLFEVETDKTTMEVESVEEGYLREKKVSEGQTVPVGTVIALLSDEADEPLE